MKNQHLTSYRSALLLLLLLVVGWATGGTAWAQSSLRAPAFSQSSCTFFRAFELTLTDRNSEPATLRYTLDGSEPTASHGTVYSAPIPIPVGQTLTVKAVAVDDTLGVSPVAQATYTYELRYELRLKLPNPNAVNYVYCNSNSTYNQLTQTNPSSFIPAGETVNLSISFNTGYSLEGLTLDGRDVKDNVNYGSYSFTMPEHDVDLVVNSRYNPSSPSDPQPADTTRKYQLTITTNPVGAGNNESQGRYAAGERVYVSNYPQSGYVFTGWTRDGQTFSTENGFYFDMPATDVVLTANFVYRPTSPSDPEQPALMHPLTAVASPAGSASFSTSGSKVKRGEEYYVYAYPTTGYRLKGWLFNGQPIDTTATSLRGTMTEAGAHYVALCVFDPSSPSNPGANYYNEDTGQLIVDDFTTGNLYNAMYQAVGSSDFSNVSHLIVKGRVNSSDISNLSNLPDAQTVDLSRVGEELSIQSYAFESMNWFDLLLPACTKSIGSRAFSNCPNLQSITVYAQEPPTCSDYAFNNFSAKDYCTVYVPAEALPLYEKAKGWKDLDLQPISNDTHTLEVNLSGNTNGKYKHNSLELVNINTGVRQKYVVTDRSLYSFYGLQKDEQYNIYMYSQSGLELGRIENVTIPDGDLSVSFSRLKQTYKVEARVNAPEEVTDRVTVEWLRPLEDGTTVFLRKGATLTDIPEGQQLICRVTLGNELGTAYVAPKDSLFTVDGRHTVCEIALQSYPTWELRGGVSNADGTALSGATVTVSQMVNGRYEKTFTTQANGTGAWTLEVLNAPETRVTYAAPECVTRRDTLAALPGDYGYTELDRVTLKSIVGARITYGFTFREAGEEEASAGYDDQKNVALSVYNLTQQREHRDISVQYPLLVILDSEVQSGDRLRVVATSKTGQFPMVADTVTVGDDQRAQATFHLVGKGGIRATYAQAENPAVTALLYAANGELLQKATYADQQTTFTHLDDGSYTLVTMGESDLMGSVLRLANFAEMGLAEGKDYVKHTVLVQRGRLTEVAVGAVPAFDESIFAYTTEGSGISSSKSSLSTGAFLTLRTNIGFRSIYKDQVKNVALTVDLPDECDFVEKSVIQGPNLLPYTRDGHRLVIQLGSNWTAQTRFCVIPTKGGAFNANASVSFELNGRTLTQPLGSALAEVKDLEIVVPSVIASPRFKVTGMAKGHSQVSIIENGAVLGTGKANAAGTWNVDCALTDSTNQSTHTIYAEITTTEGTQLVSESKQVTYDQNAVQVAKVTMLHFNPEIPKTFTSEFNFLNPKTEPTQWTLYYPKKRFTYTVEFNDNNPQRILDVVLHLHTADGRYVPVEATYNAEKHLWMAEVNMGSSSDGYYPVNCSVDFEYLRSDGKLDKQSIMQQVKNERSALEDITLIPSFIDSDALNIYPYFEWWQKEYAQYGMTLEEDESVLQLPDDFDNWTDEQKKECMQQIDQQLQAERDSLNKEMSPFVNQFDTRKYQTTASLTLANGSTITVKKCDGITPEQLTEQGFTAIECLDSTTVYVLTTDEKSIYADLKENLWVETTSNVVQTQAIGDDLMDCLRSLKEVYKQWDDSDPAKCINTLKEIKGVLENARIKCSDLLNSVRVDLDMAADKWLNTLSHQQGSYARLIHKAPNTALADVYREKYKDVMMKKTYVMAFKSSVKPAFRLMERALPFADVILTTADLIDKGTDIWQTQQLIDHKTCLTTEQREAFTLRNKELLSHLGGYTIGTLIPTIVGDAEVFVGLLGTMHTGGASLSVSMAGYGIKTGVQIGSIIISNYLTNDILLLRSEVNAVKCGDGNGLTNSNLPGAHRSGCPDDIVYIDPAGYVYEAVPSNRVEGVQASIYYKETKENMWGDPVEEIVLWNAEEYAQKNPLFTDEHGMYRWDVPQGLWQVKFEKEGYVTTYSDWLPVPPPQLEVNVGIRQNKQPEVKEARAYEEGVEVTFDKYMDLSTLTTDNIYVVASDEKLEGEIRLLDASLADEFARADDAAAVRYASRLRFVPATPLSLTTGEVRLIVSRNVKSYAGIPMAQTYSQVLDVEEEVQAITADNVKVLYGGEKEITVHATPFDAAVGRHVSVANSSALIASLGNAEATFDEEGKATFLVKGELPGTTLLTFTAEDCSVKGECTVDVVTELITAEAPSASRASGTAVYRGTKVSLSTDSKNATIYFTTDGSCPCDENGTRRKYSVPFVIDSDTHIKAMTAVGNGDEDVSETVEFNYTLKRSNMDFQMANGWTWISHSFESPIAPAQLAADEHVSRILSQTQEVVRDPQLGLVGTLASLSANESYKVQTADNTQHLRLSDVAWNPATPIALKAGWNWLGYPVPQTMTPDEAFATTAAESEDVIVGQEGFAQFDGEHWIGTLRTLAPGKGYLYQSASAKDVVYNTAIVSKAAAKNVLGISEVLPWAVDIRKYANVMPMVATVCDADGAELDNSDYRVAAFCGSECRGIGQLVNGLVMMNVYGNNDDRITFRITDAKGEQDYRNDQSLPFGETMVGSLFQPHVLQIGQATGISQADLEGRVKVIATDGVLRISGIAPEQIESVEIFDLSGRKVLHADHVTERGIAVSSLHGNTCVVVVNAHGNFTYHKVAIH